ncbi:NAD-binding protein [Candidatus Uhrbacteria bacterium]|nr:NAD-binding protein [Candidatus Uhrbacteria bacterium]
MASPILIVGSSHLAFRLGKKLRARNVPFAHIPSERFVENTLEKSDIEHAREVLSGSGAAAARAVCLVDDSDAKNINLLLATLGVIAEGHVYVAITNENLSEHIESSHPSVHVFNPHAIAAATFVHAVRSEVQPVRMNTRTPQAPHHYLAALHTDHIIRKLLLVFVGIVIAGTLFFRWSEDASWVDSVYLVATLVTSLNFEDAIVSNYSVPMKVARTVIILSIQFFILIAFSIVIDRIIKRRTEILEFGRKHYAMRNHIIICGLGRTGFHVVMELIRRGERVIVMESNAENRFLSIVRTAGAHALIGDASLARNLSDAGVDRATCLISTINDDLRNLEIGLNARSLRNDIRLVLRIFDREIADEMKTRFNIHFAYSTSSLAAQHLVGLLTESPDFSPSKEGEMERGR